MYKIALLQVYLYNCICMALGSCALFLCNFWFNIHAFRILGAIKSEGNARIVKTNR